MSNHTILMDSGAVFDFGDLGRSLVWIEDIAHNLARLCRFVGGVIDFYSVAQHSVYVAALCSPKNQLRGLLHDAHEAYTGDMNAPLKNLPELAPYRDFERRVDEFILRQFGFDEFPQPEEIGRADKIMRLTEQRDLRSAQPQSPSTTGLKPLDRRIVAYDHRAAERMFLDAFHALQGGEFLRLENLPFEFD